MPLGTELGLGPGDIVLDEDPASPPQKGVELPPNCRPMFIVSKRLDDQDGTWRGGRPQPRGLCVRWEPIPLPK